MTDHEELIWLAGLLEGEGCFDHRVSNQGTTRSPRIRLGMVDEDVVARVAGILNRAYQEQPTDNPKHQTHYTTTISGFAAVDVMEAILPYMGKRRSEKIESIIAAHRESGAKRRKSWR